MTGLAFALFVVAILVMVGVHIHLERKVAARRIALDDADEARQLALYKQQKALTTRITAAERATAKMVDETRSTSATLKEDARLMHARADTLLREAKHGR